MSNNNGEGSSFCSRFLIQTIMSNTKLADELRKKCSRYSLKDVTYHISNSIRLLFDWRFGCTYKGNCFMITIGNFQTVFDNYKELVEHSTNTSDCMRIYIPYSDSYTIYDIRDWVQDNGFQIETFSLQENTLLFTFKVMK